MGNNLTMTFEDIKLDVATYATTRVDVPGSPLDTLNQCRFAFKVSGAQPEPEFYQELINGMVWQLEDGTRYRARGLVYADGGKDVVIPGRGKLYAELMNFDGCTTVAFLVNGELDVYNSVLGISCRGKEYVYDYAKVLVSEGKLAEVEVGDMEFECGGGKCVVQRLDDAPDKWVEGERTGLGGHMLRLGVRPCSGEVVRGLKNGIRLQQGSGRAIKAREVEVGDGVVDFYFTLKEGVRLVECVLLVQSDGATVELPLVAAAPKA